MLALPSALSLMFSNTFFMLFVFPLGVWQIHPGVNQLYFESQQLADHDA